MTATILIKNGLIIDPSTNMETTSDLRIAGNTISEIGSGLAEKSGERVIDAKGLWVCPGFIDIHCHLRDLGQKDKEDIDTGTRAAAAGGYTTVVAMANTVPPVDNVSTLSTLLSRIAVHAHIEVLPVACVTKSLEGAELTNMVELAQAGAVAFSDDGMPITNMAVLRRALEYARLADRVVISHAEDKDLTGSGVIHEGPTATALGLPSIPAASEAVAVAREIEIVRATRTPYHFTHLSCAASVELVRRAKQDGLPITSDCTPHHLSLTVDKIETYDSHFKMKPPLRAAIDQEALLAGLKDGTIDAIGTDHAPHTRLEKQCPFDQAAVGLIGLETAFPLVYEKLVLTKAISKLDFVGLFTRNPANILDLNLPSLQKDSTANIVLIDPEHKWTYDAFKGSSRSHNSPFHGRAMTGKAVLTIFRGNAVYSDESTLAKRTTQK